MKLVNRSVLVLKPTAKMLDWINSVGEDSEEQASFIRSRAKKLFEHELEAWCTDPAKWPTVRNHKTFLAWFRVEVSHMVFDLAGDPIVLQAYDMKKIIDQE